MSFEDELDETGIGLAMRISGVGDHHPHLDAAAFERDGQSMLTIASS